MITTLAENEIMNSFNNLIPYFHHFFDDELVFTISNTEYFLKVVDSANIKLSLKTGDSIASGSGAYECLKQKKPVSIIVPENIFGVALKAMAVPVKENGQIVGTIVVSKSLGRKTTIFDLSENVSDSLSKIADVITEITNGVNMVSNTNTLVQKNVDITRNEAKNTDEIIRFVENVARQTNLLGLNAAIEASRAGEYGKGFSVVANEIRKLSVSSSESIKQIDSVLRNIQASVTEISSQTNESSSIFQKQVESINKISELVDKINSSASVLKEMASKL